MKGIKYVLAGISFVLVGGCFEGILEMIIMLTGIGFVVKGLATKE